MRDAHDTRTDDLLPGKRGRPCEDLERGPMTEAERARRYRARRSMQAERASALTRRRDGELHAFADAVLLEAIRSEAAFLDRLLSRETGNRGATPSKRRIGKLVAELARRYPTA